jgi:hypothetical protein
MQEHALVLLDILFLIIEIFFKNNLFEINFLYCQKKACNNNCTGCTSATVCNGCAGTDSA